MLVTAELVLCALAPLASRRTHPPLLTAAAPTGVKQFDGAASAVFNNLRIPAALVAGAAFGGAFGLQLNSADAFALALAKRAYVVIAVMALASELLVVVTATCALDAMNRADSLVPAETLSCWFERNGLELENLVCTVHFFFGVLGLTAMVGLRAWITISCARIAKGTLGLIASVVLIMISMLNSRNVEFDLFKLSRRYSAALYHRIKTERPIGLVVGIVLGVISVAHLGETFRLLAAYHGVL